MENSGYYYHNYWLTSRNYYQPSMNDSKKLNISILTNGGRGDVQPYLALGVGLQKAGYNVKFATSTFYEDWVRSYGLDFDPISINPQKLLDHPDFQKYKDNTFRLFLAMPKMIGPLFTNLLDDMWAASQGADLIVMTPIFYGAFSSAEKLGTPAVMTAPFPFHPTSEFPVWGLPNRKSYGKKYNQNSYFLSAILLNLLISRPMSKWRKKTLGLPPFHLKGRYTQCSQRKFLFSALTAPM